MKVSHSYSGIDEEGGYVGVWGYNEKGEFISRVIRVKPTLKEKI